MKLKKLNQDGISHYLIPALVVLAVVAIGVKVLTASHADPLQQSKTVLLTAQKPSQSPVSNEAILTSVDTPAGTDNGGSLVPISFIGPETVTYLAPQQSLTYTQGVKGTTVTSCYSVYVVPPKAGTATVTAAFATNNNQLTETLSSNTTGNLERVCVPPGSATASNPGFNVKNLSPANTVPGNIEIVSDSLTW